MIEPQSAAARAWARVVAAVGFPRIARGVIMIALAVGILIADTGGEAVLCIILAVLGLMQILNARIV